MDLFEVAGSDESGRPVAGPSAPLAVRMRPRTLDEVSGQEHLLAPGAPLTRLIQGAADATSRPSSIILYGPPGTGKTTFAYLIAQASERRFVELSAVTAGVKDVRLVIEDARRRLATGGADTVLFIDEVHRFSKTQQDALLPSVENGWVTLVAATTENPSFSVISPLLSRSLLVTLHSLEDEDISTLVERAISDDRGLADTVSISEEAVEQLVRFAAGDARRALTILEAAAGAAQADSQTAAPSTRDTPIIDIRTLETAIDVAAVRYDRDGDQHYDVISAFIKSMRGSDVDAALHYLARMIVAGEDPRFIARRIVIAASEDVGMADPSALQTAVAASQAVALIGMPEARIILAEAVVHVATAPKSNASYLGIDAAIADVRKGGIGLVPPHLRDAHYSGAKKLGHGQGYKYAHDEPHGVAAQQYLPDALKGRRYYDPTDRGFERALGERLERIRDILRDE
ncbi:replication-associated recombination protein A [Rarobacter faecitabidus]|uniref:replication-associated recombination protein A n=1 Tax=Rarobacter faecitabidus TaxID=13243 RepID=UPI00114F73FD|nr:replication-associated recombination protein A [Rarobacter faecitabidus]